MGGEPWRGETAGWMEGPAQETPGKGILCASRPQSSASNKTPYVFYNIQSLLLQ